jgi:transcriptional regulator with XRE-family HTH domain
MNSRVPINALKLFRQARKDRGLSRPALAKQLGIAVSTVDNWANGSRKPGKAMRPRLLAKLWAPGEKAKAQAYLTALELPFDDVLWRKAVNLASQPETHAKPPDTSSAIQSARVLKRTLADALRNRFFGVLRCGYPLSRTPVPGPWIQTDNRDPASQIDPAALASFISETRRTAHKDLHDRQQLDLFLVGDESFSPFGLHADDVVLVCPGCCKHDGLVLLRALHTSHASIHPHYSGAVYSQHEPAGSIIGVVHFSRQAVRNSALLVDYPRVRYRVGVPRWPDTVLAAYFLNRRIGSETGPREWGTNEPTLEFCIRDRFDDLRSDFALGVTDAVIATSDLFDVPGEAAKYEQATLYHYSGNRLFADPSNPELQLLVEAINKIIDLGFNKVEKETRDFLSRKKIALLQHADDQPMLARLFRMQPAQLDALSPLQISPDLVPDVIEADLLWWGLTLLPKPFEKSLTTFDNGPKTEIKIYSRVKTDKDPNLSRIIDQSRDLVLDMQRDFGNMTEEQTAWKFISRILLRPISLQTGFPPLYREAMTPVNR